MPGCGIGSPGGLVPGPGPGEGPGDGTGPGPGDGTGSGAGTGSGPGPGVGAGAGSGTGLGSTGGYVMTFLRDRGQLDSGRLPADAGAAPA